MSKSLNEYTLKEFREMDNYIKSAVEFCSLVIVPMPTKHDSGYTCMKYVLADEEENIIGVCGGYSDVISLDGIGGYGLNYKEALNTRKVPISGWSIDCLRRSKCVRLFAKGHLCITDAWIGSTLSLYVKPEG